MCANGYEIITTIFMFYELKASWLVIGREGGILAVFSRLGIWARRLVSSRSVQLNH